VELGHIEEIGLYESRADAAYRAMYDAAPHSVKDHYEDACLCLANAIQIAKQLKLEDEAQRLLQLRKHFKEVFDRQFRYAGR
jgi:hypothetical protein